MKLFTAFLWISLQCGATPLYYLATGQTGAQTQIDVNHTSTWVMTPDTDFGFGGGLFTMKDGSSSSNDVILSLYQGIDATGLFLGSVDLTNSTFCAQVGNCGQFAYHPFFFAAPVTLVAGIRYFAALTSVAVDAQSQAYFIKSDSVFLSDQTGTPTGGDPVVLGPPTTVSAVPEPRTMALFGIGLAILGGFHTAKVRKRMPAYAWLRRRSY